MASERSEPTSAASASRYLRRHKRGVFLRNPRLALAYLKARVKP